MPNKTTARPAESPPPAAASAPPAASAKAAAPKRKVPAKKAAAKTAQPKKAAAPAATAPARKAPAPAAPPAAVAAPAAALPQTATPAPDRFAGQSLVVRGARQHNLKDVSLTIPKRKLVVVTGPSGSGKSSLVFDTIYAEGQRRYVESLSAYARQFLQRMDKPDVDLITGLAPAIAIEQMTATRNPRSTVATQTEVYDYLRLLFARVGTTLSPVSGEVVTRDSPRSVAENVQARFDTATRFYLAFPFPTHKGAKKAEEMAALVARGFARLVVLPTDGQAAKGALPDVVDLGETDPESVKTPPGRLLVLVDRLATRAGDEAVTSRIADSVELAFREGDERAVIVTVPSPAGPAGGRSERIDVSAHFERDGMTFPEPTPQLFSFNSPLGACPTCQGFGRVPGLDPDLVFPNPDLSLRQGAVAPFRTEQWSMHARTLLRAAARHGIDPDAPIGRLSDEARAVIWDGDGDYIGVQGFFDFLASKPFKMHYRIYQARFRGYTTCPDCDGFRLRPEALCVRLRVPGADGELAWMHIGELCELTTADAADVTDGVVLSDHDRDVAGRVLAEVRRRLGYLVEVGLDYLTLDRLAQTLSGGESQRINLATSLGSSLVGSLYVLDEPTVGLHPRDNDRLITILEGLRDIGNSVLVVEHDEQMMRRADQIIDVGPGSGALGGEIMFQGTYAEAMQSETSLTGAYLSGRKSIPVPDARRPFDPERVLRVTGARAHNLKRLDVSFPLGTITVVTGVSGSGKSTLVYSTLFAALKRLKGGEYDGKVGAHDAVFGADLVESVEMVDQTPIGKSPRSNPVTYVKAFDPIRELLASTHQAVVRGFKPATFSFNVPGGRCETCQGEGVVTVEMQFLADLYLECEACHGSRYKQEVLEVRWNGKNVADILALTVDEAAAFFARQPRLGSRLRVLQQVGLGYLTLGQPSNTLSGGEAQRVKLAAHLAAPHRGHTVYLFDEPTTGLHADDIRKLLAAFNALVDAGHSVVLIEHNLDVIKAADWVVDVGPEGGRRGGFVVAEGTPETVAAHPTSHTAVFLRPLLSKPVDSGQ